MTQEEKDKQELLDQIKKEVTALVGLKTKEEIEAAVKSANEKIEKLEGDHKLLKELKDTCDKLAKENEQLIAASKAQGEFLAKMQNNTGAPEQPESFYSIAEKAVMKHKERFLVEKTDINGTRLSMLDWFKSGNQRSPEFKLSGAGSIIKAAVDMGINTVAQNNVPLLRLTTLAPGTFGLPLSIYPHVIDYFPSRPISTTLSMLVSYSYEDGSAIVAEGAASAKSSLLMKTVEFPSFRISTYVSMTDKMLDNLPEALSEIARVAPDKIKSKLDSYIYSAAGDDSTSIKGMFAASKSTAFNAAGYAGSVTNANFIDLIEAMVLQCEASDYQPGVLGLNPADIRLKFNSLKNELNDSIRDNRVVFTNGKLTSVCGLNVVASKSIASNTCFVGAVYNVALLGINKDMTMEIGLNGTDFIEGQKTARIGMDVAFGVGDPLGIIYCSDMTADKNTITAGA